MAIRESMRRIGIPLSSLLAVLFLPLFSLAQAPVVSNDPNLFLIEAKAAESQQKWADAYAAYAYVLTLDRNHALAKEGRTSALRNLHRQFRHGDPSFRYQMLGGRPSEAVDFYKDVVRKVQDLYLDPDKVRTGRLFQEGAKEVRLALRDLEFRKLYLPQARPHLVDEYCDVLENSWEKMQVGGLTESAEKAMTLAREANRRLGINPRVVIIEMACGACNALDDHSFFMTTGSLMGEAGPSITKVELKENDIGYIKLMHFQESTYADLESALAQLTMAGMKVLVLDLRDNPGGDLDAAVQVAERFLNSPLIIATTAGKHNRVIPSYNMNAFDLPIYVLVDGNTASAAELVAGALKSHQRAELVGETTYGKNQIQKLIPLGQAPGGALRVSWAQFYLPRTHDLSKQGGIVPTIPESDPMRQLEVALERARMLIMR